jgi:hypothetical protein
VQFSGIVPEEQKRNNYKEFKEEQMRGGEENVRLFFFPV